MRRAIRQPLAVVFALLVVTAGALGAVTFVNDDVTTLGEASDQVVQRGDALGGVVAVGALGFAAGVYAYHKYTGKQPKTEELQKADAVETKKAIYDQASIQAENNDIVGTAYGNYLNDTESIALMVGKNAYIKALENGSTEPVARNQATEAVADYYSVKQQQILAAWNVTLSASASMQATARNTTDVSGNYVGIRYTSESNGPQTVKMHNDTTTSVQLVNASTEQALAIEVLLYDSDDDSYTPSTRYLGPDRQSWKIKDGSPGRYHITLHQITAKPPNSNYDELTIHSFGDFSSKWAAVQQQNSHVQAQLDTFISNTYDNYQQGEINTSDLVDPYLGAREYSPETSDTWSLRTLSAMGLDSPQNLSNIGVMNVTTGGETYRGVLMSDAAPSGGFVVNQTYNATQLNGSQFVAGLDGTTYELDGDFTVTAAETTDGTAYTDGEAIEYRDVTYATTDTQEFQALQQQLDELTAQINARQQKLRNSGGTGWLPGFGDVSLGQIAPVALLAGAALVLLGRN